MEGTGISDGVSVVTLFFVLCLLYMMVEDRMDDLMKRLTHWPSTLEGVGWFEVISRGWGYLMEMMHCDTSQMANLGFYGGVVAFVRFALAKGSAPQTVYRIEKESGVHVVPVPADDQGTH